MFMKRRINHSGYLWIKSYLLFFIPFLQLCLRGLSCGCNYHISLVCGVSTLEHQSGWLFACAATTAREVHNYLFFSQNKFALSLFLSALSPSSCCRYQREPIPHVKCPLCRIIKQCIMAKNCETQHSHHHPSMHTWGHTCTYTHGIPLFFVPSLHSLVHIQYLCLCTQTASYYSSLFWNTDPVIQHISTYYSFTLFTNQICSIYTFFILFLIIFVWYLFNMNITIPLQNTRCIVLSVVALMDRC